MNFETFDRDKKMMFAWRRKKKSGETLSAGYRASRRFGLEERVESAERQPSPGNLRSLRCRGAPEHEGVGLTPLGSKLATDWLAVYDAQRKNGRARGGFRSRFFSLALARSRGRAGRGSRGRRGGRRARADNARATFHTARSLRKFTGNIFIPYRVKGARHRDAATAKGRRGSCAVVVRSADLPASANSANFARHSVCGREAERAAPRSRLVSSRQRPRTQACHTYVRRRRGSASRVTSTEVSPRKRRRRRDVRGTRRCIFSAYLAILSLYARLSARFFRLLKTRERYSKFMYR